MRLALLALFWRFETPPQLSPLPVMRNINRPANSFTVTGDAEYKHAGNKVSLALCPLSRGLIFFRRWALVEYIPGHVYFVKDEFFDLVQDPYLMKNYPETKPPTLLCDSGSQNGAFLDDSM